MAEVPSQKTPISLTDAAGLLVPALEKRLHRQPYRQMAKMFLAQLWNETARGLSSIGHALGNIMAAGFTNGVEHFVWSGDYWRPPWFRDVTHPLHADMLAGKAPSAFRAYASHALAMDDYANTVLGQKYHELAKAAETGDPLIFAKAVSSTGYTYGLDIPGTAKQYALFAASFDAAHLFDTLPESPTAVPTPPASIDFSDLPTIRQGDHGGHVALWQKLLGIAVTGAFDFATSSATQDFQAKHGITVDGVVGPKESWKAMLT